VSGTWMGHRNLQDVEAAVEGLGTNPRSTNRTSQALGRTSAKCLGCAISTDKLSGCNVLISFDLCAYGCRL
jgi:hypothetical protein